MSKTNIQEANILVYVQMEHTHWTQLKGYKVLKNVLTVLSENIV